MQLLPEALDDNPENRGPLHASLLYIFTKHACLKVLYVLLSLLMEAVDHSGPVSLSLPLSDIL